MTPVMMPLTYALLVVSTPLIVTHVVAAAAGQRVARRRPLAVATTTAFGGLAVWTLSASPLQNSPIAWHAVEFALFVMIAAGLGWPALRQIEDAARAAARASASSGRDDSVRTASLTPRRLSDVLPIAAQMMPFAVAITGTIVNASVVLSDLPGDRRPWLALALTACALVFLALYAIWMQEEVIAAPLAGRDADRDAQDRAERVRRVYAAQVVIVVALLSVGEIFARVDRSGDHAHVIVTCAGAIGGLVGILGCAYALSSGFTTRLLQWEMRR
jgi:hypothetical protein